MNRKRVVLQGLVLQGFLHPIQFYWMWVDSLSIISNTTAGPVQPQANQKVTLSHWAWSTLAHEELCLTVMRFNNSNNLVTMLFYGTTQKPVTVLTNKQNEAVNFALNPITQ